jgi:putative spermidine/putrescine transport system substrate-binding protein
LALGLFALSGPLGWLGPAPSAQAQELVIAAWGDPYRACWAESIIPQFEQKHNLKVIYTEGFSSQTLGKLKAQQAKPEIDIAMMDDGPFYQAVQLGLIEELDFAKIPNANELYEMAREPVPHGVLFGAAGTGLWYNEKIFKEKGWAPPSSWNDLFRPEFNKRIATHTIANSNGLMVLRAMNDLAGGKEPENMDPGFERMKELAKIVVTFDQFGETPTLIQQEATVMGPWNNDRVWNLANKGVPIKFVFPKEGVYGWREAIGVPKGRPAESVALAHDFINMMASQTQQLHNAKCIGFFPMHKQVQGFGSEEDIGNMKLTDWGKINKYRKDWTERWNKEVERRP